jgi:hypothetical protein
MGALEHIILQILDGRLTAQQTSRALRELLKVAQNTDDTPELADLNLKLMKRWRPVFYPEGLRRIRE